MRWIWVLWYWACIYTLSTNNY